MDDLKRRFDALDGIRIPDLRGRIERGPRLELPSPPRRRRIPQAIAVLGLAAASVFLVVRAFQDVRRPTGQLRANGPIVYTDAGPQPGSIPLDNTDLFALDPATGERVNLTNTTRVAEQSPRWSPDGTRVVYARTAATGGGVDLEITHSIVVADSDFSDPVVIRRCSDPCGIFDFVWAPDGTRLAWTGHQGVEGGSVLALQVYDLRSGSTTTLCDSRTCGGWPGQPAWSPDGTRIAFSNAGSARLIGPSVQQGPIWIADVASGRVSPLTEEQEPCTNEPGDPCIFESSPAWSPDGRTLAFVRTTLGEQPDARTEWLVIEADGSGKRVLLECDSSDQCRQDPIVWSPDGASIAFIDRYDHPVLHVVDPTSGGDIPIPLPASAGQDPYGLLWSPDATKLAFLGIGRHSDLFLVDPAVREVSLAASELTADGNVAWLPAGAIEINGALTKSPPATTEPAGQVPDGTIVFASSNGSPEEDDGAEIWAIRPDGTGVTRVTDNQHIDGSPALSPDGSRIAFASYRPGDSNTQIYVMNRDGTDQRVLTDRSAGAGQPAWSPDGARICFVSSDGFDDGGIFVMNADGSDQHLVAGSNTFDPAWSPDGVRIVYALNTPDGQMHLHTVDVTTGEISELPKLPGQQQEPAWSPDGSTIAFVWWSSAGQAIYTMRLDGSELRKVAQGANPAWSLDGSWLAYTRTDDLSGPQIWAVAADGLGARPVTSMRGFVKGTAIYSITGSPSWG